MRTENIADFTSQGAWTRQFLCFDYAYFNVPIAGVAFVGEPLS
jgi:hypothetical protein